MSVSSSETDIDTYLHPLDQAEEEAFLNARRPALADPLEKGVVLSWSGPIHHPDTLPPPDYPHNEPPESTPNPPRPFLPSLLSPISSSQNGEGWSLCLRNPLQSGVENWSQIWRCEVVPPQKEGGGVKTVVLKLRQETLFPPPEGWTSAKKKRYWEWWPSSELLRAEAMAYSCVSSFSSFFSPQPLSTPPADRFPPQPVVSEPTKAAISPSATGSTPSCSLAVRMSSVSFLRTSQKEPLGWGTTSTERSTETDSPRPKQSLWRVSPFPFPVSLFSRPFFFLSQASLAFQHQRRLHNNRVLNTWPDIYDVLIPRSSRNTSKPLYIALGFGNAMPLEKMLRSHERHLAELEATGEEDPDPTWTWQRGEQMSIESDFKEMLLSMGGFHRSRCDLPFIVAD